MHLQNDPIFTEADLSGGRGGGVSKGQRFEEGSRGVATVSQICLACGARPEMDNQALPSTTTPWERTTISLWGMVFGMKFSY